MRATHFVLSSISAITAAKSASTVLPTIISQEAIPIIDPIPVPETPSRSSTGIIPEDLKNAMQGIQSLASDLILQAYNIGGDGVKVQIIGVRSYLVLRRYLT
jgi:hypothetical protein